MLTTTARFAKLRKAQDTVALSILYRDACMIVADKPPGLLSVPGRTPASLVSNAHTLLTAWALERQAELSCSAPVNTPSAFVGVQQLLEAERMLHLKDSYAGAEGLNRYRALRRGAAPWTRPPSDGAPTVPLMVHRLDEATSGLLAFGLSYPMQRALSAQLRPGGAARKVYEAVVDSRAAEVAASSYDCDYISHLTVCDDGVIDTPLRRHNHLPLIQVPATSEDGYSNSESEGERYDASARACVTKWRVLERGRGAIRLELEPLTGRTHQLRLHCALPPPYGLGCPIVGDSFYGDPALTPSPYLLELLARAKERRLSKGQQASAELLASDHAARVALLTKAGRDDEMPALTSCPFLPSHHRASYYFKPLHPVSRLLLHARELHIEDRFSHADRVLTRAKWVQEGKLDHLLAKKGAKVKGGSASPTQSEEEQDDEAALAAGSVSSTPALRAAMEAGAAIWEQAAPWKVADCTSPHSSDALEQAGGSITHVRASETEHERAYVVFKSLTPF